MIRRLLRAWWVRFVVLPVLALVLAHAGITLGLMWRFEARLDDLRAGGAPVASPDLAPPPVPAEDNAAPLLIEAERFYAEHLSGEPCRRWIGGESPTVFLREYQLDPVDEAGPAPVADFLGGSWLVRPIAYGDALRVLDLFEAKLALADLPAREAHARAGRLEEQYERSLPWIVSSLYAPIATRMLGERVTHLARMRIARTALALLELRTRTGAWPGTLADAVALVGADAVVDPYTDDRLIYEPGVRLAAARPIPGDLPPEIEDDMRIVWRFR